MFRAKFKTESVENFEASQTIKARPVMTGSEENKSFCRYTPMGEMTIMISKETDAYGQLEPGQEFYLDFTPIEKRL